MFILYDVERSFDERVCRSSQDVRDTISGADLNRSHFIVVEFDTAEGRCRDVTSDFVPEEVEAIEDYRINRTAAMRRAGVFGRA